MSFVLMDISLKKQQVSFVNFVGQHMLECLNCQARGPDHVQVNSRKLQGLKKLLVILRSQGLDQEIDSIIGRSHHHHPPPRKLFWIQ